MAEAFEHCLGPAEWWMTSSFMTRMSFTHQPCMAVSSLSSREIHHLQQGEVQVQFQTGHFCRLKLSSQGYQIDSTIAEAITKFPIPSSPTDLQSLFGLTNQLSTNTDETATLLEPLYPLLSTRNKFTWTTDHDIRSTNCC